MMVVESGSIHWLGVAAWRSSTRLVTSCHELKELFWAMLDSQEFFKETCCGFGVTSTGVPVSIAVWVVLGWDGSQDSVNAECDEWMTAAARIGVASM